MFCTFFSRQNDFLYSWRTFLVLIRSIPQAPYKALINGVFHDLCHNRVFNLEHFRPAAWWNVTTVNGNRVDLDIKWCIMGRKSFQILCFCFAIWAAAHTFVHMVFDNFTFMTSKINFYNRPWTLHQSNTLNPIIANVRFYLSLTKMHQRFDWSHTSTWCHSCSWADTLICKLNCINLQLYVNSCNNRESKSAHSVSVCPKQYLSQLDSYLKFWCTGNQSNNNPAKISESVIWLHLSF